MQVTDWFPPELKPIRIGWFEAASFDCGWLYEWKIWWDGEVWRDQPNGWALNQNQTWRGQTK